MEVPFKAPLSEIFAALSGVTCAAIAIVRGTTGLTKEDALGDAGYQAASKSYDIKAALIHKKDAVTQEFLAKDALQFLDASASVLCWYPDVRLMTPKGTRGKSTKELLAHIEDMLEREKSDGPRVIEKFNETGDVKTPFQAAYLPRRENATKRNPLKVMRKSLLKRQNADARNAAMLGLRINQPWSSEYRSGN